MHVYIYDSFLNQKKYDNELARIETRITDLGLNGKIDKMGLMKSAKATVEQELKRGATTIIAVGNDQTINQVINAMVGSQVPLGIIPIGEKNNTIAETLGIEIGVTACNTLSARRIESLDIARAGKTYFLTSATIDYKNTILEIKKNYTIEVMEEGIIYAVNLATKNISLPKNVLSNPNDGQLELFIKTKEKKKLLSSSKNSPSIFSLKNFIINNTKNKPLIVDGMVEVPTPAEINIEDEKINFIVGKNRRF